MDEDERDRRADEICVPAAVAARSLVDAAPRLLPGLPEAHAAALRRYLAARELAADHDSGRLDHGEDRALEEAGVQFGLLVARVLHAEREPERLASEARWAELERGAPERILEVLQQTLSAVEQYEPREASRLSTNSLARCVEVLESYLDWEPLCGTARTAVASATCAVDSLLLRSYSRREAHAHISAVLALFVRDQAGAGARS